jgi:hypothetical protein
MSAFGGKADIGSASQNPLMTQSGHGFEEWWLSSTKLPHESPTKCEIAHAPLKRNSLKLICSGHGQGTANGKRERALARVLDVIDGDARTIR